MPLLDHWSSCASASSIRPWPSPHVRSRMVFRQADLQFPRRAALPRDGRRARPASFFTDLTEAFFTDLRVAFWTAFCLAFPVIAAQIWLFVAPGLYRQERKAFLPYLARRRSCSSSAARLSITSSSRSPRASS